MTMRLSKISSVAAALAVATLSHAVVIDFEDLSAGDIVTTQYPGLAFSSSDGNINYANSFGTIILGSGPIGGGATYLEDTYLDFATPVNSLEFDAIEPNFAGVDATFHIFHDGGIATEFLTGLGGPGNKHVDLSSFTGVTRLEIVDILDDPNLENGIGWDNFSFQVVPEPTSLLALGTLLVALARHQSRSARD